MHGRLRHCIGAVGRQTLSSSSPAFGASLACCSRAYGVPTSCRLAATPRSSLAAGGLWSRQRTAEPLVAAQPAIAGKTLHATKHTVQSQSSAPSLSGNRARRRDSEGSPSHRSEEADNDTTAAAAASRFALDPPFTPVRGESSLPAHSACVYVCRRCRTPLFHSEALVEGSAVGNHCSGWPTFVSAAREHAIRLSTVLQRTVAASSSHSSASTSVGAKAALAMAVPDAAMVPRGLAVEGDLVRRRGRPITAQSTQSWREACLRDENHRADPTLVVGCCGGCGSAVCRVTHSGRDGARYVSTAACIDAEPLKCT